MMWRHIFGLVNRQVPLTHVNHELLLPRIDFAHLANIYIYAHVVLQTLATLIALVTKWRHILQQ